MPPSALSARCVRPSAPAEPGIASISSVHRRPSARCPCSCQNRHSAATSRSPLAASAAPRPGEGPRGVVVLHLQLVEPSDLVGQPQVRLGRLGAAEEERQVTSRGSPPHSPAASSCSPANSRIVSSIPNRIGPERRPRHASPGSCPPATPGPRTRPPPGPARPRPPPPRVSSPPAKTDDRRNTARSGSSRRSWLHAMASRRVRWRAGRSTGPPVSSSSRCSSRSRIALRTTAASAGTPPARSPGEARPGAGTAPPRRPRSAR